MSFKAKVENASIRVPEGVYLPDGTEVTVDASAVIRESSPAEPLSSFLARHAGTVTSGVGDMAVNHDHYAHGSPRRSVRP